MLRTGCIVLALIFSQSGCGLMNAGKDIAGGTFRSPNSQDLDTAGNLDVPGPSDVTQSFRSARPSAPEFERDWLMSAEGQELESHFER